MSETFSSGPIIAACRVTATTVNWYGEVLQITVV